MVAVGTCDETGHKHYISIANTENITESRSANDERLVLSIQSVAEVLLLQPRESALNLTTSFTQPVRDLQWFAADRLLCAAGCTAMIFRVGSMDYSLEGPSKVYSHAESSLWSNIALAERSV